MKKSGLLFLMMAIMTTTAFGQQKKHACEPTAHSEAMAPWKHMMQNIPDLTEEQQKAIKDEFVAFARESKTVKNELGEMKAHMQTLMTADEPDREAIYDQIDGISEKETLLKKMQVDMALSVRSLLNDEQKLAFDMHRPGKKDYRR